MHLEKEFQMKYFTVHIRHIEELFHSNYNMNPFDVFLFRALKLYQSNVLNKQHCAL